MKKPMFVSKLLKIIFAFGSDAKVPVSLVLVFEYKIFISILNIRSEEHTSELQSHHELV